ncbi:maleylpyruvate isomerase N-terminal domain-containing protein [Paracoccus sp. S1E-3]|uniref:maleylpyruvate isomerase N-terminal domain-containing protein n=1 Tax=Paracoccus sp. S1E-3 TaxID=2756130 RepID=UPI0015EF96EE|nr:maleylpyruvate isomerase N-terminal domain-containing protein [Paracoccus sp. S1E-3]MBA4489298.1 maleylpyruvate isomerase N-terminal domain-containing protein [Paracoccus sp. S1E-3]
MTSDLKQAAAELRARQGDGARYDAANAPAEALLRARRGAAYLARIATGLTEDALRGPSARPGWTRARVIAAVALQARGIAQALEDATGRTGDRAETDLAALDLAETLPARALNHLAAHAEIHLNVVWRDLGEAEWGLPVTLPGGAIPAHDTPRLHARTLWRAALELNAGARRRDLPSALAAELTDPDLQGAFV